MKLISLQCKNCGATLEVNRELTKCMCTYCGNEMLIDNEIQTYKLENGYQFGYEQELGRLRAQHQYQESIQRQQLEKKQQDKIRLLNTPLGWSYREVYNRSWKYSKNGISDDELYQVLLMELQRNPRLRYEYENNISRRDIIHSRNYKSDKADIIKASILISTIICFIIGVINILN